MIQRVPLTAMKSGETGTVAEIAAGMGAHSRMKGLGIRHGVSITKVSSTFVRGPVVLRIGGTQAVLGFGISSRVIVAVDR